MLEEGELSRLARSQLTRPDQRAAAAPRPPSLALAHAGGDEPPGPEASVSLAQIIAAYPGPPLPSPPPPPEEVSGARSLAEEAALRLYISGRSALLRGALRDAINDLEAVTRLDPGAVEPWEVLGEARTLAGNARGAIEAYAAAAARGSRDPRVTLTLARHAIERRDHAEAVARLAPLLREEGLVADPGVRHIAAVWLGEALHETGRLAAGNEALAIGLDLPDQFQEQTGFRNELAEIYRTRSERWRDVGDAASRIGDLETALRAYENASRLPTFDPAPLLTRRIEAAMRLGRSALAAQIVVGELIESPEDIQESHVELVRHIAWHSGVGSALGRVLSGLVASSQDLPPTPAGRLARAAAACLPPREGRDVLRAHLARAPWDDAAVRALYESFANGRNGELADAASMLVELSPLHAPMYAEVLARSGRPLGEVVRSLDRRSDRSAALLRAAIAARAGGDAAATSLRRLLGRWPDDPAALAALAHAGAATGDRPPARDAIDRLRRGAGPLFDHALPLALHANQRFSEALERWQALAGTAPAGSAARRDALLLGADAALVLGRPEEAAALLGAMLRDDRYHEPAYLALIDLYKEGGPLADAGRLVETLRTLREAVPLGRGLQSLRAQELVRARQLPQAEELLLRLAEQPDPDGDIVGALTALWLNAGESRGDVWRERGIAWLRDRTESEPGSPWPVIGLARLLAATGDADAAERTLTARLAATGSPEVAAALEDVLRGSGRAQEANLLALGRLRAAPSTIDATAQLAALLMSTGRLAEATETLRARLSEGVLLRPRQAGPLQEALLEALKTAGQGRDPSLRDAALLLVDEVDRVVPALPASAHQAYLALLLENRPPSIDRLADAMLRTMRQHPGAGRDLCRAVAMKLQQDHGPDTALAFVRRAALRAEPADATLHHEWLGWSVVSGRAAEVEEVIAAAIERGVVDALLAEESAAARAIGRTPGPADLAYAVAVLFASEHRDQEAEALYRLALSYDPAHPWANNNLGYALLERGEPPERVAPLLEAAYAALPNDANIVDSLGWLRYRQGIIDDQLDAQTGEKREGAISLLRRAVRLPDGRRNATIHDHLGDALWVGGERDEAVRAWGAAERLAGEGWRAIGGAGGGQQSGPAHRLRALAESAKLKQAAAATGAPPEVAPHGDGNRRDPAAADADPGPGEAARDPRPEPSR